MVGGSKSARADASPRSPDAGAAEFEAVPPSRLSLAAPLNVPQPLGPLRLGRLQSLESLVRGEGIVELVGPLLRKRGRHEGMDMIRLDRQYFFAKGDHLVVAAPLDG